MFRRFAISMIGLAVLVSPAALYAQDDCTADIRGTVKRKEAGQEHTKYTVRFDVAAQMKCAVVRFDVIVIEEDLSGEQYEYRMPKKVRIRDSRTVAQKFSYKLKKGQSVADYRIEQTSCKICE